MKRKDFLKLSSASAMLFGLKSHAINFSYLERPYDYSKNNSQYMGDFVAPKINVVKVAFIGVGARGSCLLYTSPSPRDAESSRMPSSA